jgi:hypothetical protein
MARAGCGLSPMERRHTAIPLPKPSRGPVLGLGSESSLIHQQIKLRPLLPRVLLILGVLGSEPPVI